MTGREVRQRGGGQRNVSEQGLGGLSGEQPWLLVAEIQCGWATMFGKVVWVYNSKGPECHTKKLLRKTQQKANGWE